MEVHPSDIEAARSRIAGIARPTPLIPSPRLGEIAGAPVHLKLENLQATGSFKLAFLCIPVFMLMMAGGVWLCVPEHAGKELNKISV